MPAIGYTLSSEEHPPSDLVRHAWLAEEAGFTYALVSDHFHPWVDAQGESPFVWATLGGIAEATERLRIGTGVTCPLIRIHPALVAQAAATVAALMPGRFFLGLGTGENLNEHVVGARWPAGDERLRMLTEAVEAIRLLWTGETVTHRGRHYTVERARIYTLPEELPPIVVAATKPGVARLAAANDGLVGVAPDADLIRTFEEAGGAGKPRYGQVNVCWGEDAEAAKRLAYEVWPNGAIEGELNQELPEPAHFEQATGMITPDDVAAAVPCGPDPEPIAERIDAFADAGYDHVYLHQVGPDQEGFLRFAERELLPRYAS